MYSSSGSRRWTHFRSALQLAIQRSAHKWTFEDFAECFPSYVEEDRNGASATFASISEYIESENFNDLEKLFKDYSVQENIDILHKVVNDAKDRKAKGEITKDIWKADLEPHNAVCARTIPILESEVDGLRDALLSLEEENRQLCAELEETEAARTRANQHAEALLDKLDNVYDEWQKLPAEEVEAWTVQTMESLKAEPFS